MGRGQAGSSFQACENMCPGMFAHRIKRKKNCFSWLAQRNPEVPGLAAQNALFRFTRNNQGRQFSIKQQQWNCREYEEENVVVVCRHQRRRVGSPAKWLLLFFAWVCQSEGTLDRQPSNRRGKRGGASQGNAWSLISFEPLHQRMFLEWARRRKLGFLWTNGMAVGMPMHL